MWLGVLDVLEARPTKVGTQIRTKPMLLFFNAIAWISARGDPKWKAICRAKENFFKKKLKFFQTCKLTPEKALYIHAHCAMIKQISWRLDFPKIRGLLPMVIAVRGRSLKTTPSLALWIPAHARCARWRAKYNDAASSWRRFYLPSR